MTLQTHKVFTRGCTTQYLTKLLWGCPAPLSAGLSARQPIPQVVSPSVSPPALPAHSRNVSAHLIQPCLALPLQNSETWSRSELFKLRDEPLESCCCCCCQQTKPAHGTNTFHSETARPRGAQGSIKCFFLPCSEDLLACSGGASGIIVGLVLSH